MTEALSCLSGNVPCTARGNDIYNSKGSRLADIEPEFLLTVHGI